MYEIDFLQVSTTEKSGDAITARFARPDAPGRHAVIVVDGGYATFGPNVVEHIRRYYRTNDVDMVVSTHLDADHINGLAAVIEQMNVGLLLLHRPALHGYTSADVKADVAEEVATIAARNGVRMVEPFAGVSAFGGALTIAGPTEAFYLEMLDQALIEKAAAKVGVGAAAVAVPSAYRGLAVKALSFLPPETLLDDDGGTSPSNNTSVIVNLTLDGERMLLTGDAGVPALHHALDYLDTVGLSDLPPTFLQVPHHGSRHNLDADLLDRLLGAPGIPRNTAGVAAFISASADAPKHPSPKVTNALLRRGVAVYTTETGSLCHPSYDAPPRAGWYPAPQVGPRDESDPDE